jgi:predicted metal-dependent peptidase
MGNGIILIGENRERVKLINPDWDRDTPCVPTSVLTPSGPHKLTIREANKRVEQVRQYCITKSPGFASVAASVRHNVLTPVSNMFNHVAFTDGWSIWYGSGFFTETTKAQSAIVIHEVLHVALRHPQRGLTLAKNRGHEFGGANFNPYIWNLAIDCIVNLSTFKLDWVEAPRCGAVDFKTMLDEATLQAWPPHKWSAEKLYCHFMRQAQEGRNETLNKLARKLKQALDRLRGNDSGGGGQGDEDDDSSSSKKGKGKGKGNQSILQRPDPRNRSMGGGGGKDKEFDADPDTLLGDVATTLDVLKDMVRQDTEREARNWHSRVERAAAGDRASGVMREAVFDLPQAHTPWQTILRRYMTRHVLPRTEPHLYKPGRQMLSEVAASRTRSLAIPFNPGIQPCKGIAKMVVCVDTSGSITENILKYFCSELQAIRNRVGAELVIIACDADCDKPIFVARHENLMERIKYHGGLRGGGGTDFRPAVAAAEKIEGAAVVVYLTDMMGPFPDKCRLPLVWAATADPHQEPPCGRVIRVMESDI